MLTPQTVSHMFHSLQDVEVEFLEGEDASNSAAKQSHGVNEWLYNIYSIAFGATLWHTKTCYHTIAKLNTGMR